MRNMTFEPARPLDTDGTPWIPTGPGKSFRPLRFAADGWSELMRLEPGSAVAVHRHTGEVIESVNAETQRAVYLAWCQEHGVDPAEQLVG
jgi:hypothetical protein